MEEEDLPPPREVDEPPGKRLKWTTEEIVHDDHGAAGTEAEEEAHLEDDDDAANEALIESDDSKFAAFDDDARADLAQQKAGEGDGPALPPQNEPVPLSNNEPLAAVPLLMPPFFFWPPEGRWPWMPRPPPFAPPASSLGIPLALQVDLGAC
jgi:hypothetical protein